MAQYVLSIYRNQNVPAEDDTAAFAEYYAKAVETDLGTKPNQGIKTVTAAGAVVDGEPAGDFAFTGAQVFEAADENGAVEIAKNCPILKQQGCVSFHPKS